ncbi:hypothetical protein [Paenibacillus sp. DYY-L-2]|uniref:hypothetical protein n=1 Tax=Paenibacillus sp. DYY-L-2 TaxID=3447013 RepID=UPI003F4FFCA3
MHISFSTPASTHFSIPGIKVSGLEQKPNKQDSKQDSGQDYISISYKARNLQGDHGRSKVNQIVESLMKQKENLQESKKNLIDRTLENGGQLNLIKDQLSDLDEQIRNIDEQISQQLLDERKKALGLDDEDPKNEKADANKPKTEQEAEAEKLQNVVSLVGNMDQVKTMSSLKRNLQGQARILQMEISLDEQRSSSPSSLKREQLDKLKKGISELERRIGETTSGIMDKLKEDSKESGQQEVSEPSVTDSERIRSAYSLTQQTANQKEDEQQFDFIA